MKDYIRYQRQMLLPGFGPEAQEKLLHAKVIVVGAGGLGCPALQSLAAAGVGRLAVADYDRIDVSNLHRQTLYTLEDTGKLKAEVAAAQLAARFPDVQVTAYPEALTAQNVVRLIDDYDVVVDCTDSFSSRYLINDACLLLNKTFVYGAIFQFEGQAAVFNYPLKQGRSCHYRDLFPNPPQAGEVPSCNEAGVLGTLTAIIGNLQANEVIKIITGLGIPLLNRLFVYNSLTGSSFEMSLSHSADAAKLLPASVSAMEATDYNFYCSETRVEEIDGEKFTLLLQQTHNPVLIVDVRNENEIPQLKHPGVLKLPLAEFPKHEMNIPPGETLVLICQSGIRSRKAAQLITNKSRFKYIFNLQGGVNELEIKGII